MIQVREVQDKDIIPLADFLPLGISSTTREFWLQRFELWWNSNPAYTPQIPRGWILENDSGIVGFLGNIPVKFLIRGEVTIAAASSGWYVDPSVRGIYSLRLFNEFVKQKNVSLFLFKAEDEPHRDIMHKYKFEEHILPRSQKEYACILNHKKVHFIFLKFIFDKRLPKLSELGEIYKRCGFLMLGYLFQPRIRSGMEEGAFTSSVCTACDDSFLKIREPFLNTCTVTIAHDPGTLNWLYFSPARFHKRVVIQCHRSRDSTLAGYMVFDIEWHDPTRTATMRLMDMCIADNDPGVMASLTSFAVAWGKKNNAALFMVWGDSRETDRYFRSVFTMRKAAHHYRYLKFSDPQEAKSGKHRGVCLSFIYPPQ